MAHRLFLELSSPLTFRRFPQGGNMNAVSAGQRAQSLGMKIMLGCYGRGDQASLEYFFGQCQAGGITNDVIGLYPQDEPDVAGMTGPEVTAMCQRVRAAAAKYWPIVPPLCCIYGNEGYPGIASFDVVGRDNYGNGVQTVPISGTQQLMIVPGGADDWREEPYPFVTYAQDNPDVWAVICFYWDLTGQKPGVKTNGMAAAYIQAGQALTGRS